MISFNQLNASIHLSYEMLNKPFHIGDSADFSRVWYYTILGPGYYRYSQFAGSSVGELNPWHEKNLEALRYDNPEVIILVVDKDFPR